MNKEVVLVLKDTNESISETTSVVVRWSSKGIGIYPHGYGTDDCSPIFVEKCEGDIRVIIWGDNTIEEPTHIIPLAGARERKGVKAIYTSVWEGGTIIPTSCIFDIETKQCFDIELSDVDPGNSELIDEYVTVGDVQYRAVDGVDFIF